MVASLFLSDSPAPLKTAHLIAADSPRQAFYTIWIEPAGRFYRVCKISGAGGRVWHRQALGFDTNPAHTETATAVTQALLALRKQLAGRQANVQPAR